MPTCQNCGAHVSARYVRVRCRPDEDRPEACPQCPDLVRIGAIIRPARSARDGRDGAVETDAEGRFMATGDGGDEA